jgi:hypothetical protein
MAITNTQLVKLVEDQYRLRLEEVSAHIKMMVNTGAWTGDGAQVALDLRTRLKTALNESGGAVQSITNLLES